MCGEEVGGERPPQSTLPYEFALKNLAMKNTLAYFVAVSISQRPNKLERLSPERPDLIIASTVRTCLRGVTSK
jgi:hypothetical protein